MVLHIGLPKAGPNNFYGILATFAVFSVWAGMYKYL